MMEMAKRRESWVAAVLLLSVVSNLLGQGAVGSSWQLVWADEFEEDGAPDPAKWDYDLGFGNGGWGNSEVQRYTDELDNARVENGNLVIEVHQVEQGRVPGYTSARLVTRGKASWLYGRVEARAKLPSEVGTWAAIWMLAEQQIYGTQLWPDNGEIDIMEQVGYELDAGFKALVGNPQLPNIHGTLHTNDRNFSKGTGGIGGATYLADSATTFNIYAVNWHPDRIEFELNGSVFFTLERSSLFSVRNPPEETWPFWPFDQPFHLIVNVAIGGDWGGVYNTGLYPSSPYGADGIDHDGDWPQRMEIDYIRVYQLTEERTWLGLEVDESGNAVTPSWMGTINVNGAPWIYSHTLSTWLYPESALGETFRADNQWIYIPR
jgi:beta-glucanase (GH16 family)